MGRHFRTWEAAVSGAGNLSSLSAGSVIAQSGFAVRIYAPDYVIVQDATILGEIDVEEGLKPDGIVLDQHRKKRRGFETKKPKRNCDICRTACPSNSWPSDN